ncbi:hypothetical protein [Ammoniphilus resinae]|uniref:Uncharacterized protein n=1 Tax=Ammoniphilus resinae TaxID=861532 RepID=A0ABS4GNS2_9BACL|nr:hypothetical protein [Ammoniphilus resinae]MBP1931767.1 hypothetical protein [Ammoniphilus resinae]
MSKLLGSVYIDTARVAILRESSQKLWTAGSGKPLGLKIWGRNAKKAMQMVAEAYKLKFRPSHHQFSAFVKQDVVEIDAFLESIRNENCWFMWSIIQDNSYDRLGWTNERKFQIDTKEPDVAYIVSTWGADGMYPVFRLNDGGIMIFFGEKINLTDLKMEVLDTFTLVEKTDWIAADPCYIQDDTLGVHFTLKPGNYRVEHMLVDNESLGIRIVIDK